MTPPQSKSSNYIIRGGAEGRERHRALARVHRRATIELLQRAGIRPGMMCLDVGCGSGDFSFDLGRLVEPGGKVIAIDVDDVNVGICEAETKARKIANIEFRVANINDCELPQEFDLAYARAVLSHLQEPEKVLAKIRNAIRPGGIVVIIDTDFRAHFAEPECPALKRFVDYYVGTLERRGGNANIGPRLPALLNRAGFENIQISVYQNAGTQGEEKLLVAMTMESIADAVIAEGLASREDVDQTVSEFYDFARNPNTLLSGPRMIQTWAFRPAA
jgi:ubiquinone/menaquinone biosynthesis C-methylase UbiE